MIHYFAHCSIFLEGEFFLSIFAMLFFYFVGTYNYKVVCRNNIRSAMWCYLSSENMYVFFFQVSSGCNNAEPCQFYFKNGIDSDLSCSLCRRPTISDLHLILGYSLLVPSFYSFNDFKSNFDIYLLQEPFKRYISVCYPLWHFSWNLQGKNCLQTSSLTFLNLCIMLHYFNYSSPLKRF